MDAKIAGGADPGPLAGIPIGVKDLEDAAGYTTTHGSPLLRRRSRRPRPTRPFVARLRAAGCIVVGKTNTPEFGWTGNTTNAVFGPTRNPFDLDPRTRAGPRAATAAALAAGMVPARHRLRRRRLHPHPVGLLRPLGHEAVARPGARPAAPTPPGWLDLSTNGPMARRIADVALALDVVVGPDPTDLRSLPRPEASWLAALEDPHVPVQIAWSPTLGYASVDAEVLPGLRARRRRARVARRRRHRRRHASSTTTRSATSSP